MKLKKIKQMLRAANVEIDERSIYCIQQASRRNIDGADQHAYGNKIILTTERPDNKAHHAIGYNSDGKTVYATTND